MTTTTIGITALAFLSTMGKPLLIPLTMVGCFCVASNSSSVKSDDLQVGLW